MGSAEPPLPAARGIGLTLDLVRGELVRITVMNGETCDFEFKPGVAGPMRFEVRQGLLTPSSPLFATMSISVLAAEAKRRSP